MIRKGADGLEVTVIIPAYNEEETIEKTLQGLKGIQEVAEVIVVDDGSTDTTGARARACGARVIQLTPNQGKGKAMQEGLKHAQSQIIAFLDGDLGETAGEVRVLLEPVLSGNADMTVARWPKTRKRGGFGLAQGLARWGIRRLTGFQCHSPLSGQRVVKREFLEDLEGGFGVEVGMTLDCLKKGGRMQEIPVNMKHRPTGRDFQGFRHRGKQFYCVARVLAKRLPGVFPWK
jgi:hypothetical protein